VLGRIHAATADDAAALARRFATDANFHAIRLEPYLVEASARCTRRWRSRLLAIVERTASTRRVLVHGDVSPKNILVGAGRPGAAGCRMRLVRRSGLRRRVLPQPLPAEGRASAGRIARDCLPATAASSHAYWPHVARWEPRDAVLETARATLLPALALARIDGKSPVEYLGEPQPAGGARCVAIACCSDPPSSLETHRWPSWAREFTA
jgi:hypothetical protein